MIDDLKRAFEMAQSIMPDETAKEKIDRLIEEALGDWRYNGGEEPHFVKDWGLGFALNGGHPGRVNRAVGDDEELARYTINKIEEIVSTLNPPDQSYMGNLKLLTDMVREIGLNKKFAELAIDFHIRGMRKEISEAQELIQNGQLSPEAQKALERDLQYFANPALTTDSRLQTALAQQVLSYQLDPNLSPAISEILFKVSTEGKYTCDFPAQKVWIADGSKRSIDALRITMQNNTNKIEIRRELEKALSDPNHPNPEHIAQLYAELLQKELEVKLNNTTRREHETFMSSLKTLEAMQDAGKDQSAINAITPTVHRIVQAFRWDVHYRIPDAKTEFAFNRYMEKELEKWKLVEKVGIDKLMGYSPVKTFTDFAEKYLNGIKAIEQAVDGLAETSPAKYIYGPNCAKEFLMIKPDPSSAEVIKPETPHEHCF